MFDHVEALSFPQREEEVLAFWEKENVFLHSIERRKGSPFFSFYDGPPFATGLPHYGHLLAGTIKDVVLRYKTMKGFYVPRRFGWDCHGLPVEYEVEKTHQLHGSHAIEKYGIAHYNQLCESIVLRYTEEWTETVNRMGRWVDFSHTYKTMDVSFMESVWWVFHSLYEKGLIYEGYKVMPFSPTLGTPLSNFEAGENYKEVDDPAITVMLPLVGFSSTYALAWTTTPWTLPSNLVLAIGKEIAYVMMEDPETNRTYLLSKHAVSKYDPEGKWQQKRQLSTQELLGLEYEPLFAYFADKKQQGAFRIILSDHVTTEEGTGIVHMAPAFGEDDFYVCQREKIPVVCPVDENGCFTNEVSDYATLFVKDADKPIIQHLKQKGLLLQHKTLRHRYPYCYRSDSPLIYRAMKTWFVNVETLRDKMLKAAESIHWCPGHIKEGRFGQWLANARDWAISRNRYWGTPLPVWRSESGKIFVCGSVEELEALTGQKITNLHRHHIDHLTFEKEGEEYRRVDDVLDCWFESGSMPYAQNHYPFSDRALFEQTFPSDFIAEGLDQTRGWFYTLTIISAALFDRPAFKNVIVNGIVLAEDGNKMSKRLKNYPMPKEVIDAYGADAIRLYLLHSGAVKGEDLRFSKRGVELVLRQVLLPLWNSYNGFFLTYARLYRWRPDDTKKAACEVIDQWILSLLDRLIEEMTAGMEAYNLALAVHPLVNFIDQLTNWYIRRNRRRFWEDQSTQHRDDAFSTLYTVLKTVVKLMAPFAPFLSEAIYRNLRREAEPESVHLCDYPTPLSTRNIALEKRMELVQTVTRLGHSLRKKQRIKVRQPLAQLIVATDNEETIAFLEQEKALIEDELNVKEVFFTADEEQFVHFSVQPHFPTLGKKVGKYMKQVQLRVQSLTWPEVKSILQGNSLSIAIEENAFVVSKSDIVVKRQIRDGCVAMNDDTLTVVLETALSKELILEGLAREIVNKVNTMRRQANFNVTDRIVITLQDHPTLKEAWENHQKYITEEILATQWHFQPEFSEGEMWDINGIPTSISIEVDRTFCKSH